ncbi:hypothetical protein [Marinobacterium aestuariivivens]|uniref:Uncharacterized protein n=1 Tax=Marinobacterium aestuariivivens TaxID=1698799 RepID=A0ABW2A1Y5_9GAMM
MISLLPERQRSTGSLVKSPAFWALALFLALIALRSTAATALADTVAQKVPVFVLAPEGGDQGNTGQPVDVDNDDGLPGRWAQTAPQWFDAPVAGSSAGWGFRLHIHARARAPPNSLSA